MEAAGRNDDKAAGGGRASDEEQEPSCPRPSARDPSADGVLPPAYSNLLYGACAEAEFDDLTTRRGSTGQQDQALPRPTKSSAARDHRRETSDRPIDRPIDRPSTSQGRGYDEARTGTRTCLCLCLCSCLCSCLAAALCCRCRRSACVYTRRRPSIGLVGQRHCPATDRWPLAISNRQEAANDEFHGGGASQREREQEQADEVSRKHEACRSSARRRRRAACHTRDLASYRHD